MPLLQKFFQHEKEEGKGRLIRILIIIISLEELLHNTDIIRYSTTIATNAIIQKNGTKIGLIVTKGFEDSLYAPGGKVKEGIKFIFSLPRER